MENVHITYLHSITVPYAVQWPSAVCNDFRLSKKGRREEGASSNTNERTRNLEMFHVEMVSRYLMICNNVIATKFASMQTQYECTCLRHALAGRFHVMIWELNNSYCANLLKYAYEVHASSAYDFELFAVNPGNGTNVVDNISCHMIRKHISRRIAISRAIFAYEFLKRVLLTSLAYVFELFTIYHQ